jgi:ribosome biogenesis GTPase
VGSTADHTLGSRVERPHEPRIAFDALAHLFVESPVSPSLTSLGWTSDRLESFAPLAARGLSPGRVTGEHRGQIDVFTATGTVRAWVRGTLQQGVDAPGVGDWVGVRLSDDPTLPAMVEAVLPRHTHFVRKAAGRTAEPQLIAANVDVVFIASSLNSDLNLRRLERYLAAVVAGGATPVVVLTKADLIEDPAAVAALIRTDHVVWVSALRGRGLDDVAAWCRPGVTVALVGTSGVGKSTLVNALLGEEAQDTGGIRERDERGQHTTTARTLLPLPGGGCLIDTPGMRELGLWEGSDALDTVYDDIAVLAEGCPFRDCQHQHEPGCAVVEAVGSGQLEAGRLAGYHKLQRELAGEARRKSTYADRQHHRRWGKHIKKA